MSNLLWIWFEVSQELPLNFSFIKTESDSFFQLTVKGLCFQLENITLSFSRSLMTCDNPHLLYEVKIFLETDDPCTNLGFFCLC